MQTHSKKRNSHDNKKQTKRKVKLFFQKSYSVLSLRVLVSLCQMKSKDVDCGSAPLRPCATPQPTMARQQTSAEINGREEAKQPISPLPAPEHEVDDDIEFMPKKINPFASHARDGRIPVISREHICRQVTLLSTQFDERSLHKLELWNKGFGRKMVRLCVLSISDHCYTSLYALQLSSPTFVAFSNNTCTHNS